MKHEKQDHLYLVSYAGHLIEHTPRQLCPEIKCTEHATRTCPNLQQQQQQQQQHSLFSQASWGRLEMKPERNKFKVQAH